MDSNTTLEEQEEIDRMIKEEMDAEKESDRIERERSTRRPTEIDRILLEEAPPPPVDPLLMDSTAHIEISVMANEKYSSEIISDMNDIVDLDHLRKLAKEDKEAFLKEVKPSIIGTCDSIRNLQTHTDMFVVRFTWILGTLLNHAEDCFPKKSVYMTWLRSNFGHNQLRYFQQAKEIAKMGKFALWYASLGKNRLLEFNRLTHINPETLKKIISDHPFQDTSEDIDADLFKEHIDAIITYFRILNVKITCCTFEHADIIASYSHGSINVGIIKKLKEWLEERPNQEYWFEVLVMNKLEIPQLVPQKSIRVTFNKALVDVSKLMGNIESIDTASFSIDEQILRDAHETILALADKFGVTLRSNQPTTSETQIGA